jgi:hypothetical protein
MARQLINEGETEAVSIPERLLGDRGMELAFAASRMTTGTPHFWTNPQAWLRVGLLISRDGGTTWDAMGAWEAFGGIHTRWDQTEGVHSFRVVSIPEEPGLLGKLVWKASAPILTELFLHCLRTDAVGIRHTSLLRQW